MAHKMTELLPFALMLSVLLTSCDLKSRTDSPNSEASTPKPEIDMGNISWGSADASGLQMGAWFDQDKEVVRCAIRNSGDQTICYSDYLLGDWQSVRMLVSFDERGRWHSMERQKGGIRGYLSAGARRNNIHFLGPWGMMPPKGGRSIFGPDATNPFLTFTVPLDDFQWPAEVGGGLDVVVFQSLGTDGSRDTWQGTLKSGPVPVVRPSDGK